MSVRDGYFDAIIIGAGITGLAIAQKLKNQGRSFVILEKSRGIGGRIATRRVKIESGQELIFDHGAQFFKLSKMSNVSNLSSVSNIKSELLENAKASGVASLWFTQGEAEYYSCAGGMTQLPKSLNLKDQILFNHRVIRIQRISQDVEQVGTQSPAIDRENHSLSKKWSVTVEVDENETGTGTRTEATKIEQKSELKKQLFLQATQVFFTAPLPQSLQILKDSGLPYPSDLNEVKYAKAVVGLFGFKEGDASDSFVSKAQNSNLKLQSLSGFENYRQDVGENIFSMSNQKAKGTSRSPALTVVMQPKFSDDKFDRQESEVLDLIVQALQDEAKIDLKNLGVTFMQLKKWRYSHPLTKYGSPALSLENGSLILTGDAFGGGSITGALASVEAAFEYF